MSISMTRAAIVGLTLLAAPLAQAAPLDGLSLSATYYYPDKDTPHNSATTVTNPFTVGVGADPVIDVGFGSTKITLDFTGNTLDVLFWTYLDTSAWSDGAFNGLRITLNSPGEFTNFSMTGSSTVYNSTIGHARTSFTPHDLWIDWGALSYGTGDTLTFDIGYAAPVPLPAGLPLLALTLGGLAVLGCRRAA